jgi:dCTP diphosphatase
MDGDTTISSIREWVKKFVQERDWGTYQTPRNLAESMVIECAELLELFQWDSSPDDKSVVDELSDVVIYCLSLANSLNIDLSECIKAKLEKDERKYPISKFKGILSKSSI